MMSSARLYNAYANDVLMPAMDQACWPRSRGSRPTGQTDDPRYEELLMEHHYVLHVCRLPLEEWPDPVTRGVGAHQPGDLRAHAGAERARPQRHAGGLGPVGRTSATSTCRPWSSARPTTRWTRRTCAGCPSSCPNGSYLHCPDGSHLAQFDDPEHYFPGLIEFLKSL